VLEVLYHHNNNNNNPICKAPECQKTSVALSLVGLGFHPPPGWPKTMTFFVCLSVMLLNVRVCAP